VRNNNISSNKLFYFLRMNLFLKASIFFSIVSVIVFFTTYLTRNNQISDFWQILFVVLGMTLMASMTYFHAYLLSEEEKHLLVKESDELVIGESLYLNEEFIQQSIEIAFKRVIDEDYFKNFRKQKEIEQREIHPWVVTSDSLIGINNSLSLAKLRIDIESSLRELAASHNIKVFNQHNVSEVARTLTAQKILPAESLVPLIEVIQACNKGVHGIEISDEETRKIVNLGYEIIAYIASIKSESQLQKETEKKLENIIEASEKKLNQIFEVQNGPKPFEDETLITEAKEYVNELMQTIENRFYKLDQNEQERFEELKHKEDWESTVLFVVPILDKFGIKIETKTKLEDIKTKLNELIRVDP
jgi:polyhydroxyalkanoate synthesis regulator phasin